MSRLSPTAQLLIAIVFAAVGISLFLWTARSDQITESRKLSMELATAGKKLNMPQIGQLTRQKADLEKRIAVAAERTRAEAGDVLRSPRSIPATDILLETAASMNLQIAEITSKGFEKEKLQGVSVQAMPITVKVQGDIEWLTEFMIALSQKFPAEMVKSAEITIGRPGAAGEPGPAVATIQFVIYSYDGEG